MWQHVQRTTSVAAKAILLAGLLLCSAPRFLPAHPSSVPASAASSSVLDRRVALYIPGTVHVDQPGGDLSQSMTDKTLERFSRLFGGATAVPATGAWVAKKGLVKERIQIVYSFASESTLHEHLQTVLDMAQEICVAMQQESVAVEVHGKLMFVERVKSASR